jgi:hypothetical protein
MKTILLGLCSIFMMHISNAQNSNFTGNWKINKDKTNFGIAPVFAIPAELNVKQKKDSFYLNVVNINADGQHSTGSTTYIIGTAQERMVSDNVKLVGSFNWSEGGKKLVKQQEYIDLDDPANPFRKIKETWSISKDLKILTVVQNVEVKNFESYTIVAIYENR